MNLGENIKLNDKTLTITKRQRETKVWGVGAQSAHTSAWPVKGPGLAKRKTKTK